MTWVRRGLVALLATVLVAVVAVVVVWVRLPEDELAVVEPGTLRVAEEATGTWRLGPATVTLTRDGARIAEEGRTVFAGDPGTAFLTGGRGEVTWQEHRGYFWPDVDIEDRLSEQSVDSVEQSGDELVLRGRLRAADDEAPDAGYTLTLAPRPQGGVVADVRTSGEVTSVGLVSGRSAGAGVHGFGEQFTDFDLDDRLIPVVVREQGVGRGDQPITLLADLTNRGAGGTEAMTYAAWSSYVTDDLRGVRLDPGLEASHAFAVADTRTDDRVTLEVWAPRMRAELTSGDDPASLVAEQQALPPGADRPRLAGWATSGAIVGLQGGTERVRRRVATLQRAGAEVAAVWLQDWTGQRTTSFGDRLWWTWQLDRQRYPGWRDLLADLADQGIRTTTYVNPFLVDAAARNDAAPGDESIRNLWAEARDAGYLVAEADGDPYLLDQGDFDASLVDLTDPAARDWYATVIAEEVLRPGVDGFMADFAEGLPFDARLADGPAALRHNQWPALWAETVREACRRAGKPDCVTWFRSGSLGMTSDAALFWNGDQTTTFGPDDGLASALLGSFSAGVSGWPLVHSDVGGYTSVAAGPASVVRAEDLLERWAEYAAFGVVMRTHEGNRPTANEQVYGSRAEAEAFARMTRLYAALAPYRRTVVAEAVETGVPALRHGWLVVPGTDAAEVDTQFFLGSSILVAPVLESGVEEVEVTLPPGEWVHLLTGETYAGDGVVDVATPVGTPAAFVRTGDPWADRLRAAVEDAGL